RGARGSRDRRGPHEGAARAALLFPSHVLLARARLAGVSELRGQALVQTCDVLLRGRSAARPRRAQRDRRPRERGVILAGTEGARATRAQQVLDVARDSAHAHLLTRPSGPRQVAGLDVAAPWRSPR